MNKVDSQTECSIFKLAIPLLIALACVPLPALAATFTPFFDPAEISGARVEPNAWSILQVGTGLTTASGPAISLLGRNTNNGVFRRLGSSAALGSRSLFERSIIADQSITLDLAASSACDSASSSACVTFYASKNFTDTQNPVPIPAAVWLFASGVLGVIGLVRRRSPAAV